MFGNFLLQQSEALAVTKSEFLDHLDNKKYGH